VTWQPDYVTSAGLKSYLKIDDSADDAFVALWVTAVSRNVDDYCGRQFGQVAAAEDRYYTPVYDRVRCAYFCEIDDLQDTTGLTFANAAGTAVPLATSTVAGYQLQPRNAAAKGRPYERVKLSGWTGGELTGHGKWGWSSVPASVPTAMYLQAARLNARRDSPFGIAGSPDAGGGAATELRLLAQLDPDFRTTLTPLVRSWWAG
jgi:hypothetical protein